MSHITKDQIDALVRLQQIENDTNNFKAILSNVDQRIEALDKRLVDFKQIIDEQQAIIEELNRKYRSYESDVRLNLDNIKFIKVNYHLRADP